MVPVDFSSASSVEIPPILTSPETILLIHLYHSAKPGRQFFYGTLYMACTHIRQTLLNSGGTGENFFVKNVSLVCEFRI